jgi:hypothetical protein
MLTLYWKRAQVGVFAAYSDDRQSSGQRAQEALGPPHASLVGRPASHHVDCVELRAQHGGAGMELRQELRSMPHEVPRGAGERPALLLDHEREVEQIPRGGGRAAMPHLLRDDLHRGLGPHFARGIPPRFERGRRQIRRGDKVNLALRSDQLDVAGFLDVSPD